MWTFLKRRGPTTDFPRSLGVVTDCRVYVPPVMEALGLAEVEHNPKNNRMRAR